MITSIVVLRLLSPFAPRKCACPAHFCGAKGDNVFAKQKATNTKHSATGRFVQVAAIDRKATCLDSPAWQHTRLLK